MSRAIGSVLLLLLTACATPAGQIPKEDFAWETAELPIGYQAGFRNLRQAFQTCPGFVAEGDLYTDLGEGRLTVYLAQGFPMSGRTDFVAGKVELQKKDDARSVITLAVQHIYDKPTFGPPGKMRGQWKRWASGNFDCS